MHYLICGGRIVAAIEGHSNWADVINDYLPGAVLSREEVELDPWLQDALAAWGAGERPGIEIEEADV
jgi:hypothetical protein